MSVVEKVLIFVADYRCYGLVDSTQPDVPRSNPNPNPKPWTNLRCLSGWMGADPYFYCCGTFVRVRGHTSSFPGETVLLPIWIAHWPFRSTKQIENLDRNLGSVHLAYLTIIPNASRFTPDSLFSPTSLFLSSALPGVCHSYLLPHLLPQTLSRQSRRVWFRCVPFYCSWQLRTTNR